MILSNSETPNKRADFFEPSSLWKQHGGGDGRVRWMRRLQRSNAARCCLVQTGMRDMIAKRSFADNN